jgi:hypothetical protein
MADRRSDDTEIARRLMFCLSRGMPIPDGRSPPVDGPRPDRTDPLALAHVREQIAKLKTGIFSGYEEVSLSEGVPAFVPVRNDTWHGLTELGKLAVLDFWVDWSGVSIEDGRAEITRHLDVTRLPPEIRQQLPDISKEKAGKLSLDRLKEMATEKAKQPVHRKSRDLDMDRG